MAPQTFGGYLRSLRRKRRLSQRRLGMLTGVSTSYVSMIESGFRNPSPRVLRKLAPAYGIPAKELLQEAGFVAEPEVAGYESEDEDEELDWAFRCVLSDPKYRSAARLRQESLSPATKRLIVELYQQSTGKKLL